MASPSWIRRWAWLPAVWLSASLTSADEQEWHRHDPKLWHFVTRPDLRPPKWEIKTYDAEKTMPGYWFTGPKGSLDPTWGTGQGWFGPAIYDPNGELVWSGASQMDTSNTMDFRLSYVNGEHRLAVLDRDRAAGVIINSDLEMYKIYSLIEKGHGINGHELNFVEGGKTFLHTTNNDMDATDEEKEAIGFTGTGKFTSNYNGFMEKSADDGSILYEWNAHGHIGIQESTSVDGPKDGKCHGGDFLHANSVDKVPDGDYVFSGRHCDTIFKISHVDGSIVWRLGGKNSDFKMNDVKFSRQHDVRCRGQNETHTLVSFLDNAKGEDDQAPTHEHSRGLLIALRTDTDPMEASLVASYDQPWGGHAQRRGNFQVLDNGNVFMGWSEQARQSEHSPDGTLLQQAKFDLDWMGAYRNYKFPYVGRPKTIPDAKALAYLHNEDKEVDPVTKVWVSWNGDTEVKTWKLYGGDSKDSMSEVDSVERKGFESGFQQDGYLKWVTLKGLDKNGNVLGETGPVKVEMHPSIPPPKVESEVLEATYVTCESTVYTPIANPLFIFLLSFTCATGVFLLTWFGIMPLVRNRGFPFSRSGRSRGSTIRREEQAYKRVSEGDFDLGDDDDDDSDQKLPLTENSSTNHLPRSPR